MPHGALHLCPGQQQRGIPADEARSLLTEAFLIEVVDRIDHEGAREVVREWLSARL